MAHNIFTYGSLMFPEVWSRVARNTYPHLNATLKGYERKGIRGDVFPVLFPAAAESQVQGLVYLGVSPDDLTALDSFEGELYYRKSAQVITKNGGIIPAEVYVLKEEYYPLISPSDWDEENFKISAIKTFIKNQLNASDTNEIH